MATVRANAPYRLIYELGNAFASQLDLDPLLELVTHKPGSSGRGRRGSYWLEVGVVWPHKNGNGFDIVIHEGISVSGRIVCT
jgi:hypothetical protein